MRIADSDSAGLQEESVCKRRERGPYAGDSPLGPQPAKDGLQPAKEFSTSDGGRGLSEDEGGISSHNLSEADLALVRAQLRAIATQTPGARETEGGVSSSQALAAAAEEIEAAVLQQMGGGEVSSSQGSTEQGVCAAAIETCLWFGLALGEPPLEP